MGKRGVRKKANILCAGAGDVYRSVLSCCDCVLPAAGSALYLYGALAPQKVGADQVMGVGSPGKGFTTLTFALFKILVVALFPFWKLLGSCRFGGAEH